MDDTTRYLPRKMMVLLGIRGLRYVVVVVQYLGNTLMPPCYQDGGV